VVTRQAPTETSAPVSMRVPFAPASVGVARRRLRTWMLDHGASSAQMEDARVIVSELVGNAVRHARPLPDGTVSVGWSLGDRGLDLSVTDGGADSSPHRVHAPASAVAGRGMAIVDSLAHTWWVDESGSRSTVHAVVAMR